MRNVLFFIIILFMMSCTKKTPQNPLLSKWDTPFGVPPFELIKEEHYLPALDEAIKINKQEIEAIINNPEEPTFENTIVAWEEAGQLLKRVNAVFSNISSANSNDSINKISEIYKPKLSAHYDDINLNPQLFERVKSVYDNKENINLTGEDLKLLDDTYKDLVKGGATLSEEDKTNLKKINERLSVLSVKFQNNVMAETESFELVIDNEDDLAGLPADVVDLAKSTAESKGYEGKWVFTTSKPSMIPFLQNAKNRELREKLYKAYLNRGDNNNEFDNKAIIEEMVRLRIEKANLLGFGNWSKYILSDNMAKEPGEVTDFLLELWYPSLKAAKGELTEMQQMVDAENGGFKIQPWDWWFYTERIRKEKYELNDEELKPYFELENVRKGLFELVNRIYGIKLIPNENIPVYHPDVKAFEVVEENGDHIGIILTDYYVREGKKVGAWMSSYRKEQILNGEKITPVIVNVCNFPRPDANGNSFLSFDNALTMFHEFGHGLHGLFSDCKYYGLSGTSVPRDFVELPSQIMENWVFEPEMLNYFAKHYKTNEPIPQELIEKITNASHFNQGFQMTELLAASLLDMEWHTLKEYPEEGVTAFEEKVLTNYGLIPEIISRYRSTYFMHIFSGGYSSGYYSYLWAQVLDADAFGAFKETGLFSRETGEKFRNTILSKGGTADPMKMYLDFRGREPDKTALMKRKGLL